MAVPFGMVFAVFEPLLNLVQDDFYLLFTLILP